MEAQAFERFHGVVGAMLFCRRIEEREFKVGVTGNGELGHGDAMVEAGDLLQVRFERLSGNGSKKDAVERERS